MALEQRIESLRNRHLHFKEMIHAEEARPAPDEIRLHEMKREKLILKDELERLCSDRREAA